MLEQAGNEETLAVTVKKETAILWVRHDFRLQDNLALTKASSFSKLIPVYIHDEFSAHTWPTGAASKWWLYHSLNFFGHSLRNLGSDLLVIKGQTDKVLLDLCNRSGSRVVFWNQSYNPAHREIVKAVLKTLKSTGITVEAFHGNLLCPPKELLKKDGSPYLVYTPFWRNFFSKYQSHVVNRPTSLPCFPQEIISAGSSLDELMLLPRIDWYKNFPDTWAPGEENGLKCVKSFLKKSIQSYDSSRDFPSVSGTSRLSPYLHFGEIHPQRILWMVEKKFGPLEDIHNENILRFCKEIVWREFSYQLLVNFPESHSKPLKKAFEGFPWNRNNSYFSAWKKGRTGYPIVDAGMRELWATGWMHNRVRMITASFLVKHLGIHWLEGARWFWDTLVDADLASNTQGWQWTAGCGADAQPFFRIFNPITQGEKFDPDGVYVKKWCPELKMLPIKWICKPWEAPQKILDKALIRLGDTYPFPIVDHREAREKALAGYKSIRNRSK